MKYLYGASVQGIQDFIFQTNKLKEIGGASELVEQICSVKFKELAGINDDDPNIIINAAGNIKYLFEGETAEADCKKLVRKFPKSISDFAPGITLSQVVVKFEDTTKFTDAINELEKRLKTQRNKAQKITEVGFMALDRMRRTGGVGVEKNDEVWDTATQKKVKAFDDARKEERDVNDKNLYHKFIPDVDKNNIPFDLNEISKSHTNAWIAVIHADGNGLGLLVQRLAKALESKSVGEAKGAFAKFSKELDNSTVAAAQFAFKKLAYKPKQNDKLPIRPIILGGDDITLIIRADLALDFTRHFLEEFEKQTKKNLKFLEKNFGIKDFENGLTACAGIAFIKVTYPMHYGLHLAEELTLKAKKASKKGIPENTIPPSSLSFYKVHASFIEDLKEIEEKTLKAADISFDYGPYFLSADNNKPTISELIDKLEILDAYKDDKSKGVSKLRQWISELYKDKSTADFMMKRMEVINADFYSKMKLNDAIKDNKTIIFDVLQLHSLK